jgi:hypothetical protein
MLASVRSTVLRRCQELTHCGNSSYGAGRWRDYRTRIWPPGCVPGCGRSRDCRHARYAHGHDACTFAGGEAARQKSQRRWLAQVTIGVCNCLTVPASLLYQRKSISGVVWFFD